MAPPAVDGAQSKSYWSQPARQKHGDTSLPDECPLFITWSGKMD